MKYRYQSNGTISEVQLERRGEEYHARVGETEHTVVVLGMEAGAISLLFDGRPLRLFFAEDGGKKWISWDGCTYLLEKPAGYTPPRAGGRSEENEVRAPMPASVRAVLAAEGESVIKGQGLLLIEAMKMEIRISAPRDGRIRRIRTAAGQTVEKDQILVEIES